jgi:hypothetical protein
VAAAKASRHTTTPDVARELTRIWYETDVRGVLPAVRAPALLLAFEEQKADVEEMRYVASLIPDAEVVVLSDRGFDGRRLRFEQIVSLVAAKPAERQARSKASASWMWGRARRS